MKFNYRLIWLFWAFPLVLPAQIELVLTVNNGTSTTTCTDFLGAADPLWRVNVDNQGWVVYGAAANCYASAPYEQYSRLYACSFDLPSALEVCFSAFENDDIGFELGLSCALMFSCEENSCQTFAVPAPGDSLEYILTLPAGGRSGGSVSFTLAARNLMITDNDVICTAIDLGELEYGQILGDASLGGYSNNCATILNEIDPFTVGGWVNDAGVWFTFTTGNDPGHYLTIDALSDPMHKGDSLGLELALFSSNTNECSGGLTLLGFQFNQPSLNNQLSLICPQPNTRYFVMVDGGPILGEDKRGYFGIQVSDIGVQEAPDERCDAEDLGVVPTGGSVGTNGWRSNFCGTDRRDPFVRAFQSQHSVWFKFRTPPSGHVRIEGFSDTSSVPLGIQLALYRVSGNNCNGFFRHLESIYTFEDLDEKLEARCLYPGEELYILVDGSGSDSRGVFSLKVYDAGDITPVFTQNVTICAGQSYPVYRSLYDRSGTYRDTLPLLAGCDSVIVTHLNVLQTIELTVDTLQPAIGDGAENGIAEVNASGGQGSYTYLWCNGETGQRNERLKGGEQCCVTVTDSQGCEGVLCFEVPQVLPLDYTFQGDTLDCFGDKDAMVRFRVLEGKPPYHYTWRSLDGLQEGQGTIAMEGEDTIISGLPAGSYQVFLKDQYFDTSFQIEVVEPPLLTIKIKEQKMPSCNGFCDGRVELEALGGNSDFIWTWSNSDLSGPAPDNVCAGNYEVTVSDARGCTATLSIVMDDPPPFIAIATELKAVSCFGGQDGEVSVTTNGRPVLYEWGNGRTGPVVRGVPAGSYSVRVTNEDGCIADAQARVDQPDQPVQASIEIVAAISCADTQDGQLNAIAAGPGQLFTYQWSNGVQTAQNTNLGFGDYRVTVVNEAGCRAEAVQHLEAPPFLEAELTAKNITCLDPPDGGMIQVAAVRGGRPGYSFSMDGIFFKQSPVFERLPEGDYTITVKDEAGCEEDFSVAVFGPPLLGVSLGGDRIVQLGEIVSLKPSSNSMNLTIKWDPLPEGFTQGDPLLEVQPLESVRYSITVTDNTTFCTATDNVWIQVKKDRKIFVPNVFNPLSSQEENRRFMIYGGLGIQQVDALRIFDRQGGLVFSAHNFQPNDIAISWEGETQNGQRVPSGVYVYMLEVSFIDGEKEVFSGDVSLFW